MSSAPNPTGKPASTAHTGADATAPARCPVSGSADVRALLEIERIPVHCNVLWESETAARGAPTGNMRLAYCPDSGHLFNTAFDPRLMEYTVEYENSLHYSPRFQQFAEGLAQRLVDTYDLHGKTIVEIGSGKGDFLHMLVERGDNRGLGFDPSYTPDQDDYGRDDRITFVQEFYGEAHTHHAADLIVCRHVLEHIEQPRDFVDNVRRSIGDRTGTVVYFEVPNAAYTLRDLGIWDLIYEHVSYFTVSSLTRLFTLSGFEVRQVAETYGGQFLGIEAVPSTKASPDKAWAPWANTADLTAYATAFSDRYHQKVADWRARLGQMKADGQRAVIWGTGSKGVTFLNVLDARAIIPYAVDINPRKQGKFVAGTGQKLVAPDFLTDFQPDVVIIMNPLYQDEIRQTVHDLGLNPDFRLV